MRLYRERRRQGLRCVLVEMQQSELDELIRRGLLNNEMRNDPDAIRGALYEFFDSTLAQVNEPGRSDDICAISVPTGGQQ
jgi:hypothetical protein